MPGFPVRISGIEVFDQTQVGSIKAAIFRVMLETGVKVEGEQALTLLADAGCAVDREGSIVRFPAEVIEQAISATPRQFLLRAQDESQSVEIGKPNQVYFISSSGLGTLDLDTWEQREPTRKEFYDFVRVLDALPNLHILSPFTWFGFVRVPQPMRLLETNAAKIRLSKKPQTEGSVHGNDRWNLEMARVVGQDLWSLVNPVSPLTIPETDSLKIISYAREDVPFSVTSGPTFGATSPATLAGALLPHSAEILAALVLAQTVRPGARFISGHMAHAQNMRTGSPFFGQVTNALQAAGFNQLWKTMGVPTYNLPAAWTGSKTFDYQSGCEQALSAVIAASSGASAVNLQSGLTENAAHPVKAIMDDDVAGMIGRYLEGIEVNEETLAVDVIDRVGPMPGTYLGEAHTRKWWRREQYQPQVFDYSPYQTWINSGKKTALDHAREKMEELVAKHPGSHLEPSREEALEDILREARTHYRKTGLISDEEWRLYQEDLRSDEYPFG